jgi:hypothetical protein
MSPASGQNELAIWADSDSIRVDIVDVVMKGRTASLCQQRSGGFDNCGTL